MEYISQHPGTTVAGIPLAQWVHEASGTGVEDYVRRMSVQGWGGGVELAAFARMRHCRVRVFQRGEESDGDGYTLSHGTAIKVIADFGSHEHSGVRTIDLIFEGGTHYNSLVWIPNVEGSTVHRSKGEDKKDLAASSAARWTCLGHGRWTRAERPQEQAEDSDPHVSGEQKRRRCSNADVKRLNRVSPNRSTFFEDHAVDLVPKEEARRRIRGKRKPV